MLKKLWLVFFALSINASEPPLRYLSIRPQASIEREGGFVRISADVGTNLSWAVETATTPQGPWRECGLVTELSSTNQFFRLAINTNYLQFDLGFTLGSASPAFVALSLTASNTIAFTTKSGFELRFHSDWYRDLRIFEVIDGPGTGDLSADYANLLNELWEDERTAFVGPVARTHGMDNVECFSGISDELLLLSTVTTEMLAQYDLYEISRSDNFVVTKRLHPKSMSLGDFLKWLDDRHIWAQPESIGCGS